MSEEQYIEIGKYEISKHPKGICIIHASGDREGEGMQTSEEKFFKLIDEFYKREF